MAQFMRGVMLEGVSCAGKSSTLRALKRLLADGRGESSAITLCEDYTQVLNEVGGKLVRHGREEHLAILERRVAMLEELHGWACSLGEYRRESRGVFVTLERCYLNHIAAFGDAADPVVRRLGERLGALGIVTALLVISEGRIRDRILHRNPREFGGLTLAQAGRKLDEYKAAQEQAIGIAVNLPMPVRIINTDALDWDGYGREILAFTQEAALSEK